jgi:hypothetical protein
MPAKEWPMKEALAALYALQEVDSAMMAARRRYEALDRGDAAQQAHDAAKANYERANEELHRLTRELQASELELKGVEAKKKDFETRLYGGRITAFKELEAVQSEIEALGRQRSKLDDKVLTLMDEVERQRTIEADARRTYDEAAAALKQKLEHYQTTASAIASELKRLTAEREKRAAPIPPQLLRKYDHIRAHCGGVGIAKIEDGLCGACRTSLPSKQISVVSAGEGVETCDNCSRILCVIPS